METQIRVEETVARGGRFSFRDYAADFREGFRYLSREKGLIRIYTYMPLSQGLSSGTANLVTAYFRTTPGLDMTMYAFFTTVEFIGRTLGGRTITDTVALCEMLLEHGGIALVPGESFEAPGFCRLSYAVSEADIESGMDTLQAFVGRLRPALERAV